MRKILLVALVPALLAVSACQFKEQSKVNNNLFLEDTLAHEEIFGSAAIEDFSAKPKFAPSDPIEHPNNDYSIGVQSQPGSIEDTISFRFIAPIRFEEGELNPTEAKWTRTVSKKDGTAYPKDTTQIECTTAYNAISYGMSAYTIAEYNSEHSTNFTHFVVYTLRNVPVDSNDYFVSAYLTLKPKEVGGEGGKSLFNTKAVAINASNTQKYSYVHDLGAYLLDGSFNGSPNVISATHVREASEAEELARFENILVKEGDSFVIKEFYNTKLYVHNAADVLKGEGNPVGNFFKNESGQIEEKLEGDFTFNLYYNNRGEMWSNVVKVNRKLYVYTKDYDWWGADGRFTALWVFSSTSELTKKWVTLEEDGDYLVTTEAIDTSTYDKAIVCEIKSSAGAQSTWWDNINNECSNAAIPLNQNNCAYIKGSGPFYFEWWPKA